MTTRMEFANFISEKIGAAQTGTATLALVVDMTLEDTGAANNPMATEEGSPGSTDWNPEGVKNYPSVEDGVVATVAALSNGRYDGILAGMRAGEPAEVILSNAEWNTWGGDEAYSAHLLELLPVVQSVYGAYGSRSIGAWVGFPPVPDPVPVPPPDPGPLEVPDILPGQSGNLVRSSLGILWAWGYGAGNLERKLPPLPQPKWNEPAVADAGWEAAVRRARVAHGLGDIPAWPAGLWHVFLPR